MKIESGSCIAHNRCASITHPEKYQLPGILTIK